MEKLETLLNTLIARGWKPWGLEYFVDVLVSGTITSFATAKGATSPGSLRELVSLESGLWQFVVENKLYKKTNTVYEKHFGIGEYKNFYDVHYQYRLLESALVPEEELGKFLVDNIAIGGKKE